MQLFQSPHLKLADTLFAQPNPAGNRLQRFRCLHLTKTKAAVKDFLLAFGQQVRGLGEKLAGDDIKAEVSAASLLAKIEKGLYEDGFDEKIVKRLAKFAKKNSGTAAADRANHIVKLAEMEG